MRQKQAMYFIRGSSAAILPCNGAVIGVSFLYRLTMFIVLCD